MNEQRNNNNNNNIVVDLSSLFLFESTGDSEFDTHIDALIADVDHAHDNDDAQSSSCECDFSSSEDIGFNDNDNDDHDDDDATSSSSCCRASDGYKRVRYDSKDEEEEDEEDVVEQRWIGVGRRCKKLKQSSHVVRVDSVIMEDLKTQKDKDKLFWETCLAS